MCQYYAKKALSQVGWGVPERVTKRHLYIMEDMYLYIVNTRDSSACSLITFFLILGMRVGKINIQIETKASIVYLVSNDS